jgi:hypothetical protein
MNLTEFIKTLSERAGIDSNDESIQAVMSNQALLNVELPSKISQGIQAKLMNEDEAKRNYEVKKHFTGSTLNAIDLKIKEVIDQFPFDDDNKNQVLSESNTYNRIGLLAKAISEVKDKSISAQGGEKKALLDKVNELQNLLNQEKEFRKNEVQETNSKWQNQLTDKELNSLFSNYDYAIDLDKDVTISTARNLWEKKLREKGGKYVYTTDGIKLVNSEASDLPFTIDNKTIDVKSFTDSVLAEAKLLRVNKPSSNTPVSNQVTPPAKVNAPFAKSQTSKALQDFREGSKLV